MKIQKTEIERIVKNMNKFIHPFTGEDFVCVKITGSNKNGKIEANNVIASFEYEGEDVNVAIPVRNLEAVLARCGDSITLTVKDNILEIKDSTNKWSLITVKDSVENTIRRKDVTTELCFSLQEWNALKNVLFANNKAVEQFKTLFVSPVHNGTEICATDTRMAAMQKKEETVCDRFNLPNDIFKIDFNDDVVVKFGEGIITLHSGNETYISSQIAINAPNFDAVFNKATSEKQLKIESFQLIDALNKVCIKGGENTDKVILSFISDGILMEMNDVMFGHAETKIPLLFNPFEGIQVAMDAERLLNICKHAPSEILLNVQNAETPILFSSEDGTWKAVMSPLRLG